MHFIDIHTHILPGLDDGASSMEECVEMLRIAHQAGTRTLVATPHMYQRPEPRAEVLVLHDFFAKILELFGRLSECPEFGYLGDLSIHLGAENYISPELLQAVEEKNVLTLNGSPYLLLEFPIGLPADQFSLAVRRILQNGLVPVIAHPERYLIFRRDPAFLERFLEMGCLTQLNSSSLRGGLFSVTRKTAYALLSRDLISVIASDAHSPNSRVPDLGAAYQVLKKKYSKEKARTWMVDNPSWILSRSGRGGRMATDSLQRFSE